MKKLIALLLAVVMVLGLAACGGDKAPETTAPSETTPVETTPVADTYTWKDSVSTLATNWNPHNYQTDDDSYPAEFLRVGLYGFIFNDELHP